MPFIQSYNEIPFEELQKEVEDRLQWAYAHGHIGLADLEERLDLLHKAENKDELLAITKGIPDKEATAQSSSPPPEAESIHAILSSNDRKGNWRVPHKIHCLAILGSITLDLREAEFPQKELYIEGTVFLGSIDLRLPEDVEVRVSGTPILGSISNRTRPKTTKKTVHFSGLTVLGSFTARTRKRRKD